MGRSPIPRMALDLFTENPYWSVGGLWERLEVAFFDSPARDGPARVLWVWYPLLARRAATASTALGDILEALEDSSPVSASLAYKFTE